MDEYVYIIYYMHEYINPIEVPADATDVETRLGVRRLTRKHPYKILKYMY